MQLLSRALWPSTLCLIICVIHQSTLHCRPHDMAVATAKLESCISDVDDWMSANRLKLNTENTELLWTGTRHNVSTWNESGPSLQLNSTTVNASSHVCVLGVHFSSDLSPDRHVCKVSATCFHQLRRLRRVRRSLIETLVHSFVTSRVDYCNSVLAAASKTSTDKLQRVLNAAARVVSNTRKFDRGCRV